VKGLKIAGSILLALLVIGAITTLVDQGGSDNGKGTTSEIPATAQTAPGPRPAPSLSAMDKANISASFRALLEAYNTGNYVEATAHVDPFLDASCGGAIHHALAYRRHHQVEGVEYEFVSVKITKVSSPRVVQADLTTRRVTPMERRLGVSYGYDFVKDPVFGWVLDADFPYGVGAFC
jgi:hypothetical protein